MVEVMKIMVTSFKRSHACRAAHSAPKAEAGHSDLHTLGPPLENNPKTPPSSRDEVLRLLHGLETNLATSLQTPQEA